MRTCRQRSSQPKSACSILLRRRLCPLQRANPKTKGQEKGKAVPTAILPRPKCQILLRKLAPQAGFEPATLRLTAGCSTIELLRNRGGGAPPRPRVGADRTRTQAPRHRSAQPKSAHTTPPA